MIASTFVQENEKLITGQELLAMGDIGRAELVDGRIVYMAPTSGGHGYSEVEIAAVLRNFVRARKLGWVLAGEVGIYIRRNPDTIRAADVAFVSRKQLPKPPQRGYLNFAPELIVEVTSPSDLWEDFQQKIEDYFSIGVERLWVVEPEQKLVSIYLSPTEIKKLRVGDTARGEGTLEGFELSLAELFEE